jgi:hypothetical protein
MIADKLERIQNDPTAGKIFSFGEAPRCRTSINSRRKGIPAGRRTTGVDDSNVARNKQRRSEISRRPDRAAPALLTSFHRKRDRGLAKGHRGVFPFKRSARVLAARKSSREESAPAHVADWKTISRRESRRNKRGVNMRETLIPGLGDQNPWAHLRNPMDMIFHG